MRACPTARARGPVRRPRRSGWLRIERRMPNGIHHDHIQGRGRRPDFSSLPAQRRYQRHLTAPTHFVIEVSDSRYLRPMARCRCTPKGVLELWVRRQQRLHVFCNRRARRKKSL
jgi:hypothetical protein